MLSPRNQVLKDDPRALPYHARDDVFAKVNFYRVSTWNPAILFLKWPALGTNVKKTLSQMLKDDPRALLFHARDDLFGKVNFCRISYWNPAVLLIKWPTFTSKDEVCYFTSLISRDSPP